MLVPHPHSAFKLKIPFTFAWPGGLDLKVGGMLGNDLPFVSNLVIKAF